MYVGTGCRGWVRGVGDVGEGTGCRGLRRCSLHSKLAEHSDAT